MSPGPGPGLTAGEAARQLGVAVTTLRSWHRRYGLGPTQHLPGRHRRYGSDDLARLAIMRTLIGEGMAAAEAARLTLAGIGSGASGGLASALPGPAAAGPGRAVPEPGRVAGLLDTALRLDADGVRRLVGRAVTERGVVAAWQDLICPVLVQVGERHAATGELIEVEHLLSRTVSEALALVPRPGPGVPARALFACADEEQHTLALEALAAAVAQRGSGCRLLGARVPPAALLAAVRQLRPAILVVWSQVPDTGDPAPLWALRDRTSHGFLLAVAGPGWSGELPPGTLAPADLAEAVDLVNTAHPVGI